MIGFPTPDYFYPGTEPALRWGIIAPGEIAGHWARAVTIHSRQKIVAVASRSEERAKNFAVSNGIERVYGSYLQLVEDPSVDIIYVAAPPAQHLALGLLVVSHGKHAVIEKPIATNGQDVRRLVDAASRARVFLMEAMWSRYLPHSLVLKRVLEEGILGKVLEVRADHGQNIPFNPAHRLFRADLGGGALLDLGIYPVQFSSMILGRPSAFSVTARMLSTGVEGDALIRADYDDGARSFLSTSMTVRTDSDAEITGTRASLAVRGPFFAPSELALTFDASPASTASWIDPTGIRMMDGLSWQATAAARFIGEGRIESPMHTLEETVDIIDTIDAARARFLEQVSDDL